MATALACSHAGMQALRGHLWAAEVVMGDGPNAKLRHPMSALPGLMLVQVYIGNWLMTYLYRLLIELFMAVRLCPMHCLLIFFKYMYLSKNVCLIPVKEYNNNSLYKKNNILLVSRRLVHFPQINNWKLCFLQLYYYLSWLLCQRLLWWQVTEQGLGSPFNHFNLVQTHLHSRVTYHVDSEPVMGTCCLARM